jgi:glucose-6-phosphate 1-epimerase
MNELLRAHEIPGSVSVVEGHGGLPKVVLTTAKASAEVYLHGAHVTHFQKHGDPPVIFMSRNSWFAADKPIRGGVPICFPWFGGREGGPSHGLARLVDWRLVAPSVGEDGAVTVRFELPVLGGEWSPLCAEFIVTLSDALTMALRMTHDGSADAVRIESCLHTYFHVGDIDRVTIAGLADAPFDDFAFGANGARRVEHDAALRIVQETNRVYPDNSAAVEIEDAALGRVIRVDTVGTQSTVVWNPWTTQKMPEDFDQSEYRQMVCVESGNVKQNALMLGPGETKTLRVALSTRS